MEEKRQYIYLDADGLKTEKARAVDVVIRAYDENGELLYSRIESVQKDKHIADQGSYSDIPESENQLNLVSNDSAKAERWICPNDETINTGECCIICGLPKPALSEDLNICGSQNSKAAPGCDSCGEALPQPSLAEQSKNNCVILGRNPR